MVTNNFIKALSQRRYYGENYFSSFRSWASLSRILLVLFSTNITIPLIAKSGITRKESEKIRTSVIAEWTRDSRQKFDKLFEDVHENGPMICTERDTMPFWYTQYGEAPFGERSLWISLHGGGGTTKEFNNGQWNNQKRLYRPAEGFYVAPRAPWDAWNMWFQEPIDAMFEELIQAMIACKGVSPNKIYILGYSAGGDGVWRLAPRMADHFAAASMMAGHPGDVRLENLRNLPFMIWCGAKDAAYNRNKECEEKDSILDSFQTTDPNGYIHQTNILAEKGHWMNREDTVAITWMGKFIRNPYPLSITWRQEEVLRKHFYWIAAPKDELLRGNTVKLSVKKNTIHIEHCDYSQLTLYLNDEIVNLNKAVTVKRNGKVIFKGKILRSEQVIKETLYERGDPQYCFTAKLQLRLQ